LTSPENLAGEKMGFNLPEALKGYGAKVVTVGAYEKKNLRTSLKAALADAQNGVFTTLVVTDGACIQKLAPSTQRVYVEPEACKKCNVCLICPGIELDADGIPVINNLCSGCAGATPSCAQSCPYGVLKAVDLKDLNLPAAPKFAAPPAEIKIPALTKAGFPKRLSLAIRGVGGQGNLFFGSVLSKLASLAGYGEKNILKGETHGMAQMGGPVISTFGCGEVNSPVLLPGTADCLIAMEKSEVLRPEFLEMLKPGGTVILAETRILPQGLSEEQYPTDEQIHASLSGYHVIEVDVLARALELGDRSGRTANVVMLGILSTLPPFNQFPPELWLTAIKLVNSKPAVWAANYVAFYSGRELAGAAEAVA
jgi:indolepyruvate ferredoxin oxidoreductase alpha subunit